MSLFALGAQLALAEAYRNVATTGAKPAAVSDCLNFGSPENPEVTIRSLDPEGVEAALTELLGRYSSYFLESV